MSASRVQMHLHGDSRVFERDVINQRLVDAVHMVVLCLKQERRRRPSGNRNIGIQFELLIVNPEMPRIERHGKIRTAALFVGCIYRRIQAVLRVGVIAAAR